MNAADHADREAMEADRDDAWQYAVELHDDFPHLTAEAIMSLVDDDRNGSSFFPSTDESFRREVERLVTR